MDPRDKAEGYKPKLIDPKLEGGRGDTRTTKTPKPRGPNKFVDYHGGSAMDKHSYSPGGSATGVGGKTLQKGNNSTYKSHVQAMSVGKHPQR